MGVDYSFSFVRVYQRCLDEHHPSHGPVRTSIFLSASATLIGMGTMTTAEHAVTRSAGIMATLAIGYCALGAYVILPPLLRLLYGHVRCRRRIARGPERWVMRRFRRLSAYPRMFAWFKMRLDPMFPRLGDFLPERRHGTGYRLRLRRGGGLDAGSFARTARGGRRARRRSGRHRALRARQIAASSTRAARRTLCPRSMLPPWSCLDVIHHLDDAGLAATLAHVRRCLPARRQAGAASHGARGWAQCPFTGGTKPGASHGGPSRALPRPRARSCGPWMRRTARRPGRADRARPRGDLVHRRGRGRQRRHERA